MYTIQLYRYVFDTDKVIPDSINKLTKLYKHVYNVVYSEQKEVKTLEDIKLYIYDYLKDHYGYVYVPELKMAINNTERFHLEMIGYGINPVYYKRVI